MKKLTLAVLFVGLTVALSTTQCPDNPDGIIEVDQLNPELVLRKGIGNGPVEEEPQPVTPQMDISQPTESRGEMPDND